MSNLDVTGLHCLCCAPAESTKGHYCARDKILELAHIADSSATTEIRNLFPSAPLLRLADIFTSAARQGRLAALDIGICSPDASGAGMDCTATMYENKIRKYAEHLRQDNGFDYIPMICSCYGRAHPECQNDLKLLAQRAA